MVGGCRGRFARARDRLGGLRHVLVFNGSDVIGFGCQDTADRTAPSPTGKADPRWEGSHAVVAKGTRCLTTSRAVEFFA